MKKFRLCFSEKKKEAFSWVTWGLQSKNNIELTLQYVSLNPTQSSRLIFIHFLKELDDSIHIKALSLWWLFQKNLITYSLDNVWKGVRRKLMLKTLGTWGRFLLVSCCDFDCCKKLFITIKVLDERAINSINSFVMNNPLNCVYAVTDMLHNQTHLLILVN